jgi:ATP-dependent RNA helicase SUPV3L1/SUV3
MGTIMLMTNPGPRQTASHAPVTAILGPTNTGKTHLAVERMLAMGGGMIGLPLRLLAREIYDRVRARTGDHAVALITGEEKIIPVSPRYWVCTVEAMPPDIDVPFLAIDEVQLCADLERGHIFTDRVLHRRGREETLVMGAASMRPMLEKLLPVVHFVSRPRLSKLSYAGQKKLSRLPRRSAIVGFTAETVYTVAEMIRQQQGGAAVVLGALSPRTRNAQIALYQSGDVDYLVATDAIGMGLNMDVDHIAFAQTRKFDGFQFRNLNPGELGQIAGRAGRYMNDGTFGVTGEAEPFDNEMVDRLENHNFDSIKMLQWRNRDLDFRSLDMLRKSLGYFPNRDGLTRAQDAADVIALEAVCRDPELVDKVAKASDVMRAWDVCQTPDYRNISPAEHAYLVGKVISFLQSGHGFISEDWFAKQLSHCESYDGAIDAISTRISHIRTWTFIANRADWLEAPIYWQQRAKEIEDKLSDVLHERLTQRFINRKTSVLMRRLAQKEKLMASVEDDGAIHVEGEFVGHIKGLTFFADVVVMTAEGRSLKQAAQQALQTELAARANALAMTADPELKLTRHGIFLWQGNEVGRLSSGDTRFKPRIAVTADDMLTDRSAVQERLEKFATRHIASLLESLQKLEEGEGFDGMARGIAFRLAEAFGVIRRSDVQDEVKSLSQEDRAKLRAHGVRFGAFTVFIPALLKPAATELRLLLWWLALHPGEAVPIDLPAPPANGLTSVMVDASRPDGFYSICGYRVCGIRAVRVDMLERLADLIRDRVFWKPRIPEEVRPVGSVDGGGFTVVPDMMSLIGCSGEEFGKILESLDYRSVKKVVSKPVAVAPEAIPELRIETETSEVEVTSEDVLVEGEVPSESVAVEGGVEVSLAETEGEQIGEVPVETAPESIIVSGPEEITVWWPNGTGPFRPRPERKHFARKPEGKTFAKPHEGQRDGKRHFKRDGHKNADHRNSGDKNSGDRKFEHRKGPPPKPERREKPMDPNSPFAVLAAMKAQMTESEN